VTNALKYRCLTPRKSNRREALNTLAKQSPATILPGIPPSWAFLPTCKAKRVTYYVGGWPRERKRERERERDRLLNTRLYVLVVPSGALLYEYFNLINSMRAHRDRSILSALARGLSLYVVRRRFRICRLIRISGVGASNRFYGNEPRPRRSEITSSERRAFIYFRYFPPFEHHAFGKSLPCVRRRFNVK